MGPYVFLLLCVLKCVSGKQEPSGPACFGGQADIVFLLDSSTSIGKEDFKKEVSFVSNFVQGFPVGPEAVQFSLVVFSSKVWNQFNFLAHQSEKDLLRALDNVKYRPGFTRTGTALKYIREQSYLPSNGGRHGVRKVLVVITDGISTNPAKTSEESTLLHQDGIFVISVGVGNRVNLAELRKMASNDSLVFNVKDFNGLSTILGDLQTTTCMEMADEEKCGLDALPESAPMTSSTCQSPSFVRVNIGSRNRVNRKCGGVLIGRNKVITTASCVKKQKVQSVVMGESRRFARSVVVDVQSTTVHPSYSGKGNDIAVLRLKRRVSYTACILPACLPTVRTECEPLTLDKCSVSGWESVKRFYSSKVEHFTTGASHLTPELCSLVYKYGKKETIPGNTVCIDSVENGGRPKLNNGGMVSCNVNNTWILHSLINSPSKDNFPSLGVDLKDPDILDFINNN